jgi:hypothetical protein
MDSWLHALYIYLLLHKPHNLMEAFRKIELSSKIGELVEELKETYTLVIACLFRK